jgi:hypothetical protein
MIWLAKDLWNYLSFPSTVLSFNFFKDLVRLHRSGS